MINQSSCCGGACTTAESGSAQTGETTGKGVSSFRPDVDVIERPDSYVLVADLPGADANAISIEFEQGTLTLTAPVTPRGAKGATPRVLEYAIGEYRRTFRLGESVNTERIDADFKNGVLTISLPKSEAKKPRKISVRSNAG